MPDASEPKWTPPEEMISRCVEAYDNADPHGDGTDEGMRAAISASGLPALMAAAGPIVERLKSDDIGQRSIAIDTADLRALAAAMSLVEGK